MKASVGLVPWSLGSALTQLAVISFHDVLRSLLEK